MDWTIGVVVVVLLLVVVTPAWLAEEWLSRRPKPRWRGEL